MRHEEPSWPRAVGHRRPCRRRSRGGLDWTGLDWSLDWSLDWTGLDWACDALSRLRALPTNASPRHSGTRAIPSWRRGAAVVRCNFSNLCCIMHITVLSLDVIVIICALAGHCGSTQLRFITITVDWWDRTRAENITITITITITSQVRAPR